MFAVTADAPRSNSPMKTFLTSAALVVFGTFAFGADATRPASTPPPVVRGAVYQSASGTKLRILMDPEMFRGTELEIGEITFAPNTDSGEHVHGATETFYVLEGELEHVVNGQSIKLATGMIGTVRPPDKVRHKTGAGGAKALVIWAPAGEAARIASRWKRVDQP
jgi:quercetin dioxygenase-like cupin family protein